MCDVGSESMMQWLLILSVAGEDGVLKKTGDTR